MASGHNLMFRQQCFAAKLETVAGTAVSLAASDAAMNLFETSILPDIPFNRRRAQVSANDLAGIPGGYAADVSLKCELHGKGASGLPAWALVLLACSGMAATGSTYAPVTGSATADSCTCGWYVDGWLFQSAGTMFRWTMEGKTGDAVMLTFTGKGVWQTPTAVAMIAPTFPTVAPPRFAGATFTVGGAALTLEKFTLAMDTELYLRPDPAVAAAFKACCIPDRRYTLKVDPEALALGTKDWFADYIARTEAALSIVVGASANNIATISAPKLQVADAPKPANRGGVFINEALFQTNISGSTADSELTIALT